MFELPIRTRVRNAAAVFSGPHGAVTRQARESGCSRETVYEHAEEVERRLAGSPAESEVLAGLREENRRLRGVVVALGREAQGQIGSDTAGQRRLATAAFAMGPSLRQIEDVLGLLLAGSDAKAPDHSTVGRWVGGRPSGPDAS